MKQANKVDFQICWDLDKNFGEGCCSNSEFLPLQPQKSPGLKMDLFGPEIALARSLSPRLEAMGVERAHFLKFALGSTNLHTNWNPSNVVASRKMSEIGYYPQLIKFCKESIESLRPLGSDETIPRRPILGMFWLQGESDSSKAKTANSYHSNFEGFIQAVRKDLQCPDMPVVVSPVIWHGKKVGIVNDTLKKAADSEVPNCYCIEALDREEFGVQGDDAGVCAGHLTAAGLCAIGHRMGEAVPLLPGASSGTDPLLINDTNY